MSLLQLDDIKKIPKVELHRHLELSLRPSTIKELAPQFGITLPDENTFAQKFLIREPMTDLGTVLNKFLDTQLLLSTPEILERIAFEACEDAYTIENIHTLELRYAPTFVIDRHPNLTFESIHQAFVKGVERAKKMYPIRVGLICIIQRILPLREAEKVTSFAIEHKDTFVALDLADNEVGFDPKPFAPFFMRAKKAGLHITVHAGEANTPEAVASIKDSIDYLGAERIGHGVQCIRDQKVIDYLIEKKIPLELCPTSNYLTQAVPGDKKNHPLRTLMQKGVLTTINSDDPGIFDCNLNTEYMLLHELFQMNQQDFDYCNRVAAEYSFVR